MRLRLLAILLIAGLAGAAETQMSAAKLAAFIKSSIQLKLPDKQVAQYLKSVKLTQKLDGRDLEEFQGIGAGPKTMEALRRLSDESVSLPAAPPPPKPVPPPPPIPAPDSIEQARIIAAAREYALGYTKQLPNFICVQVTRRYWDPSGTESWDLYDTITSKLSFFDEQEKYDIVSITGHSDDTPLSRLGGTITRGEFGSIMKDVFSPEEHADFYWARWATLRQKRQYVFSYHVPQEYSKYSMVYNNSNEIVPGYHGLIFIDKDTGLISRITLDPEVPATYPVQQVSTVLDYEGANVGDNVYLLPLHSRTTSRAAKLLTRNDIDFRMYRKFGAQTTVTFAPDAIAEDQLKEQPATPETPKKNPATPKDKH